MTPTQHCTYCRILMKHTGSVSEYGWVKKRMYCCDKCGSECTITDTGEILWYFSPHGAFGRHRRR